MNDVTPDSHVVTVQLGRRPRGGVDVVARCHLGLPTVVRVPPVLDDGSPFPTHYWLCCPLADRRLARLESTGAIRAMDRRLADDPAFRAAFDRSARRYAEERDRHVPPEAPRVPTGGIGGARAGVKCLHAHYAHHLAGHDNPVAGLFVRDVEPLDCGEPCVCAGDDGATPNPHWVEPRRPTAG